MPGPPVQVARNRFAGAFLFMGVLLVGATLVRPGGLDAWGAFAERIQRQMATDAYNTIGLGAALGSAANAVDRVP